MAGEVSLPLEGDFRPLVGRAWPHGVLSERGQGGTIQNPALPLLPIQGSAFSGLGKVPTSVNTAWSGKSISASPSRTDTESTLAQFTKRVVS